MTGEPSGWGKGWELRIRIWAERNGEAILGPGRLELLEHINRFQSITAAARQMRMSYRRAWGLVQAINFAAGVAMVEAQTGGRCGGGATLTPFGCEAIRHFRALNDRLTRAAGEAVRQTNPRVIHLLAAVSLEEAIGRILADYALVRPDLQVRSIFAASDELADLIRGGASADLFLTADARIASRLPSKPTRRIPLVENTLAIIASDASPLRADRPAKLLRHRGIRVAMATAGCPLGDYTNAYLTSARISAPSEVIRAGNSRAVLSTVRSGQADIGIVYSSDAANADGCRILCSIDRLPTPIRYEGAAFGSSSTDAPAIHFLAFLGSQAAVARFRECGFRAIALSD
jgi:molybdate transport system regulatory protein